jgi:isochorismate hydrolase
MNIKNKYLKEIEKYNTRKAWPEMSKTALIVIDMQNYFRKYMSKDLLNNILRLIEICQKKDVKIIFTRTSEKNQSNKRNLPKEWWGSLFEIGSREWHLIDELSLFQDVFILDKTRYSAFYATKLEEKLIDLKVDNIIVCGVMTNLCCETTARDAFMRDFRVFFISDATSTLNQELHLASLKNLAYGFAYIMDAATIVDHIECC